MGRPSCDVRDTDLRKRALRGQPGLPVPGATRRCSYHSIRKSAFQSLMTSLLTLKPKVRAPNADNRWSAK